MYSSARGSCQLSAVSTATHKRNSQTITIENNVSATSRRPFALRWLLVPVRVLLVSFLLTLLSFAVCLFLGIFGLLISAAVRGAHPNMTVAYREIAFPGTLVLGGIALLVAVVIEVRYQSRKRIESRLI